MYTAVMLFGLAACFFYASPLKIILMVLLVIILWLKLTHEEALLLKAYPEYDAYKQRTKAIIPKIV